MLFSIFLPLLLRSVAAAPSLQLMKSEVQHDGERLWVHVVCEVGPSFVLPYKGGGEYSLDGGHTFQPAPGMLLDENQMWYTLPAYSLSFNIPAPSSPLGGVVPLRLWVADPTDPAAQASLNVNATVDPIEKPEKDHGQAVEIKDGEMPGSAFTVGDGVIRVHIKGDVAPTSGGVGGGFGGVALFVDAACDQEPLAPVSTLSQFESVFDGVFGRVNLGWRWERDCANISYRVAAAASGGRVARTAAVQTITIKHVAMPMQIV